MPGVTVAVSGGVTPFIRGIGTFNAGFSESSVGVYIDGIYLPNSTGVLFSFNNVERIEVLKGPQGTLYGRNTSGGLINIITKAPSKTATMDASVSYESYNTFAQSFYGSAPVTDNLSANLAVYHSKQDKGWTTNIVTGHDVQKAEDTGVYGKIQWQPGSGTKVTASGLYNRSDTSKGWAFAIYPGSFGTDGTPYLGKYRMASQTDPYAVSNGYLESLRIDQDLGFANAFSLTAYQTGKQHSNLNQSGYPGTTVPGQGAANVDINFKYNTFSQEFQLSSKPSSSRLEWLAGAFYYRDNTAVTTSIVLNCTATACASPAPPVYTTTYPTTRSLSGYGDATYAILDHTKLTVGLRYTHEIKGFSGLVTPRPGFPTSVAVLPASTVLTPAQAGVVPSFTNNKLTFRGVLAQDLSRDVHAYASFNRGFKSGTYNPNAVNQPPVLPEVVDSYEAGIKSELFDRHLRFNVSGFYFDYTNIQVRSNAGLPAGATSIAQNVGAANARGVDAEAALKLAKGLTLNGGFEYLDAKYTNYPGTACETARVPGGAVLGGVVAVPCNPGTLGLPLPVSPKYSFSGGFAYEVETTAGTFRLVANTNYKSRYNYSPDAAVQQAPTNIIDGSITWTSRGGRFDVKAYVRNLTNRYRYQAGQAAATLIYVPGEPRIFGATIGVHY